MHTTVTNIKTVVSHCVFLFLGMLLTLSVYFYKSAPMNAVFDTYCSIDLTSSGSFLADWPLDILFPVIPLLILGIIVWIALIVYGHVASKNHSSKK